MDITASAAPAITPIRHLTNGAVRVDMLRLDEIHPTISGNKPFKLKYYLDRCIAERRAALSFGGAHSNHLYALAYAAHAVSIPCIGYVRGGEYAFRSTPTLDDCRNMGMQLRFLDRSEYRRKNDSEFLRAVQVLHPQALLIPEGGDGPEGRLGAAEIARFIPFDYNVICLPVGTGTTLAGIASVLPAHQRILGFAPMKGGSYLQAEIIGHTPSSNWRITDEFSFGGFGKTTDELQEFTDRFRDRTDIELDRVYTAKMIAGVAQLIERNAFDPGSRLLCLHTGGLQGNRQ